MSDHGVQFDTFFEALLTSPFPGLRVYLPNMGLKNARCSLQLVRPFSCTDPKSEVSNILDCCSCASSSRPIGLLFVVWDEGRVAFARIFPKRESRGSFNVGFDE